MPASSDAVGGYGDPTTRREEPLEGYLDAAEPVVYRLECDRPVAIEPDGEPTSELGDAETGAVAAVTDRRLLVGVPDALEAVAFRDVRDVTVKRGLLHTALTVRTWTHGTVRIRPVRGQPVAEAADYLERAATVRQRVLAAVEDARDDITAAGRAIEAGDEAAAAAARTDVRHALSLAARRIDDAPRAAYPSLDSLVAETRTVFQRTRVHAHLARAQTLAVEGDARAGVDAWPGVERTLCDARAHLETALRVAVEGDLELVGAIQAEIDDLDERTRSIVARQRSLVADARDAALAADSPTAAVPALATAVEQARAAASFDWGDRLGVDVDRPTRQREAERLAGRLIEARRRLADRQHNAAEWAQLAGDRDEAVSRYRAAHAQLRKAERLARELAAGDADRLADRREAVTVELAALRALAGDDVPAVAEGTPQTGVNQSA